MFFIYLNCINYCSTKVQLTILGKSVSRCVVIEEHFGPISIELMLQGEQKYLYQISVQYNLVVVETFHSPSSLCHLMMALEEKSGDHQS